MDVLLDGDPFGTYVSYERVVVIPDERDDENPLLQQIIQQKTTSVRETYLPGRRRIAMPTATAKPSARELRKEAKALRIEGWEDMSVRELQAAINEAEGDDEAPAPRRTAAKRASSKPATGRTPVSTKTPAKKAAAKKAAPAHEVAENGNPYKEGTNLWHVTEELIGGGKRSAMVKRLKKKIDLKPRTNTEDFDLDYEMDRRVLIVGQLLRKDHGFEVTREGRGPDATIVAVAP